MPRCLQDLLTAYRRTHEVCSVTFILYLAASVESEAEVSFLHQQQVRDELIMSDLLQEGEVHGYLCLFFILNNTSLHASGF